MPKRFLLGLVAAAAVVSVHPFAQEKEDRTLLPAAQMRAIINEASGERALHHVLELVPYQRVRPIAEYQSHFRESEVMAQFAKEYGFSNVAIEVFPSPTPLWQPTVGELWIAGARPQKLYDIHDVALALGEGTPTGDVTGELVDVGAGRQQDLEGRDLKGKVVLSSGGANVFAQAASQGAVGIVTYNSLRVNDYPDEIPETRFAAPAGAASPTFGWAVSPSVGRELAARLSRGERITIRSIVKAQTLPGKMEVVHAEIPGDGSTTEEVAIGGHLYEAYIKQGANDDNSGCALTLEIGRTYLKLVAEGKLPKPRRTINFQWVPEISGTNAWLAAHPDKQQHIIGDLNFDMEGIRLTTSRSYWIMQRTPDTFPSYINDIGQSMMEYVSELTRERVRYRANGYAPSVDITSPNGSRDAFYIKIDKHYGASDHVTYMQHGIPAVMFITWPDMWYHSSGDTPDKQDSTQYKRAAIVGTGALTVLATADDGLGATVAAENLGRASERMGDSERKGLAYLADAANGAALADAYKEAKVAVQHQAMVEAGVIKSAGVLFSTPEAGQKALAPLGAVVSREAAALGDQVKAMYALRAAQLNAAAGEPPVTAEEKAASGLLVECVHGSSFSGCNAAPGAGGGRGGGRGGGASGLPQHMSAEATILLGQHKTALEIRDFLSGEFEPVPIADVMAYLRAREQAGVIRLTSRGGR
jgi:hypothetical protein